jgi:lia operon protein LiaF
VLVGAAVFASVFHVHLSHGVGERSYVVTGSEGPRDSYTLGVGKLTLDLSGAKLADGETHVKASVDLGELRVIVPQDVALRVQADARLGEVHVLGKMTDGHNAKETLSQPGRQVLVLDTHVGVGQVRIVRAVR